MTVQPTDLNKVLDEATVALEGLFRSIASSTGYDVDYVPNETSRKAYEALLRVQQTIGKNSEVISEFTRRGVFKDVMDKLSPKLDSPSVQTALGTVAVELMGVFKNIQILFHEKDSRKISRKDSDPLGRN